MEQGTVSSEDLEKLKAKLELLARTEALSPPLVSLAIAVGSIIFGAIAARVVDWTIDSILSRRAERREKNELLTSLFGFCRNADYFVGYECGKEVVYQDAIRELVSLTVGTFREKPDVKSDIKEEADLQSNLVSVGNPEVNAFAKKVFEHVVVPYELSGTPPALVDRAGIRIYTPEFYPDANVLTKEYGTIMKLQSIHPEAYERGRWNLVLAGCHPLGTLGVAKALGEISILREIYDKARGREFQAVLSFEIARNEIVDSQLEEVIPIRTRSIPGKER